MRQNGIYDVPHVHNTPFDLDKTCKLLPGLLFMRNMDYL